MCSKLAQKMAEQPFWCRHQNFRQIFSPLSSAVIIDFSGNLRVVLDKWL